MLISKFFWNSSAPNGVPCKGQWLIFKFLSGMCWAVESWWSYLIISNIVFWFFPYLLSKTLLRPKVKSKNMLLDLFDSWDSTEKSSWTFGIYAELNRFWMARTHLLLYNSRRLWQDHSCSQNNCVHCISTANTRALHSYPHWPSMDTWDKMLKKEKKTKSFGKVQLKKIK